MSPPKKWYRAPDGVCDFSTMTSVIVAVNLQKFKASVMISQSPQGKVIRPCRDTVTAGSEKWEFLKIFANALL